MSEDKAQADITKGRRAAAWLEDETLQSAFGGVEKVLTEAIFTRPALDTVGREKLVFAVQALRKVKELLESFAADGRVAQAQIDELASPTNQG